MHINLYITCFYTRIIEINRERWRCAKLQISSRHSRCFFFSITIAFRSAILVKIVIHRLVRPRFKVFTFREWNNEVIICVKLILINYWVKIYCIVRITHKNGKQCTFTWNFTVSVKKVCSKEYNAHTFLVLYITY